MGTYSEVPSDYDEQSAATLAKIRSELYRNKEYQENKKSSAGTAAAATSGTSSGAAMSGTAAGDSSLSATNNNSKYYNEQYRELEKAANLKYNEATNSGIYSLQQSLADALPEYQSQREKSAYNTAKNALSLKESLALMGDRGGMARQDILQNSTAGANELNSINLQEQKLKDDTTKQIAELISSNNLQAALETANLESDRLSAVASEKIRAGKANDEKKAEDKDQDDLQDQYTALLDDIEKYKNSDKQTAINRIYQACYDGLISTLQRDKLLKKYNLKS